MFGLGFTEVVILLLLVLLVFGPSRLPEIAKDIGKGMRQIRRATKDLDTVPEIREIRKAVEEIRNPVMETLREPILDPDEEPPPLRSSQDAAPGGEASDAVPSPAFPKNPEAIKAAAAASPTSPAPPPPSSKDPDPHS